MPHSLENHYLMKLIFGDLHLLNEANDRYNKTIPNIHDGLAKLGFSDKIDSVDLVGDILDCEYVTFKRITYFSYVIDLISELFSDNIRALIGNHDKYFKNDQNDQNIIRYIKFDGEIIDTPTIVDRILYIPHYYDSNNFPIGLLNEDDFDIIIGHLGIEFASGVEELTVEQIRNKFKRKPIISGHIHNMNLDFANNTFLLGSIKSESWKEQSAIYSICVIDGDDMHFIVFPYHKMHLMIDVHSEDQFREDLLKLFRSIHLHNSYHCMYNKNGDLEAKEPADKYMSSIINLKLKLFDKNIKKKTIDLIIDFCKHEIDDPAFMNINIKTILHLETSEQPVSDENDRRRDILNIDKQLVSDQKRLIFDLIDKIKSGAILADIASNKKFVKSIESICDGEIERFSEFLVLCNKRKEFSELLQTLYNQLDDSI